MTYFPNGTSGMIFQEQHCYHCRNWREREGYLDGSEGCPVWDLHLIYNYDREPQAGAILDTLITEDDPTPSECRMFLPVDENRCKQTPDMFA